MTVRAGRLRTGLRRWALLGGLLVASPAAALDPRTDPGQYVHRRWGTAQGLPQSSVLALVQTPDRHLVVGTRGGLARWTFTDGTAILLTEHGREHKAGVWVVEGDPEAQDPILGLGPEADQLGVDELAARLAAHSGRLHGFLRDQRQVVRSGASTYRSSTSCVPPMARCQQSTANLSSTRPKVAPNATNSIVGSSSWR